MVELELIDETFDINNTSQYHISIQISLNGYCFSILDIQRNKYILLKNYLFKDQLILDQSGKGLNFIHERDEFLKNDYKSVSVIIVSNRSTLVPLPLFNESYISNFFEFNYGIETGEGINFNKLKQTDAVNLFPVNLEIRNIFLNKFPHARFYSQATPFIEKILINNKNNSYSTKLYVNVQTEFFDIVAVNQKKLELYNSFRYKTESDFSFFILYVLDQLKLNPQETILNICGELSKESPSTQLIKSFLKDASFAQYGDQALYSYTLANIPAHRFYNLLNLYHCE